MLFLSGCTKEVIRYVDRVEYQTIPPTLLVASPKPIFYGTTTEDFWNWNSALEESLDTCNIQVQAITNWNTNISGLNK